MSRFAWAALILLLVTVGTLEAFGSRGIFTNLDKRGELSHFRGRIGPTDILCSKFYIGEKTTFPLRVPVLTNSPLSAIRAIAWEYNKFGFIMDVEVGGLGATTTILNFHGTDMALYPIEVQCYCSVAPANVK